VKEAKDEALLVESTEMVQSPLSTVPDMEQANKPRRSGSLPRNYFSIHSRNPHLEAVGRFHQKLPTRLLSRCHSLCIALSAVGFVLATAGIVCYAWARHPTGVSAFSTACVGVCVIAGVVVMA
jgi:hypothetical protein